MAWCVCVVRLSNAVVRTCTAVQSARVRAAAARERETKVSACVCETHNYAPISKFLLGGVDERPKPLLEGERPTCER